eukprot:752246-Prymnesium_polylepis.1
MISLPTGASKHVRGRRARARGAWSLAPLAPPRLPRCHETPRAPPCCHARAAHRSALTAASMHPSRSSWQTSVALAAGSTSQPRPS